MVGRCLTTKQPHGKMHTSASGIYMKRKIYRSNLEFAAFIFIFTKLLAFPVRQNSPILHTWLLLLPLANPAWQLLVQLLHLVLSVTALALDAVRWPAGDAEQATAGCGNRYAFPGVLPKWEWQRRQATAATY